MSGKRTKALRKLAYQTAAQLNKVPTKAGVRAVRDLHKSK